MGGSIDVINVMMCKVVIVILKIGMDYVEYFGRNFKDIVFKKVGIMVRDVFCVVDYINEFEVMEVL